MSTSQMQPSFERPPRADRRKPMVTFLDYSGGNLFNLRSLHYYLRRNDERPHARAPKPLYSRKAIQAIRARQPRIHPPEQLIMKVDTDTSSHRLIVGNHASERSLPIPSLGTYVYAASTTQSVIRLTIILNYFKTIQVSQGREEHNPSGPKK